MSDNRTSLKWELPPEIWSSRTLLINANSDLSSSEQLQEKAGEWKVCLVCFSITHPAKEYFSVPEQMELEKEEE